MTTTKRCCATCRFFIPEGVRGAPGFCDILLPSWVQGSRNAFREVCAQDTCHFWAEDVSEKNPTTARLEDALLALIRVGESNGYELTEGLVWKRRGHD